MRRRRKLGFGSEDKEEEDKRLGNGQMEANGTLKNGLTTLTSNQTMVGVGNKTVSRYSTENMPKMAGMTSAVTKGSDMSAV